MIWAAIALIAVGSAMAAGALVGLLCVLAAAASDRRMNEQPADDLMAVADAVQDDLDEPIPFMPVDFPTSAEDDLWLRTIGVQR